MMLRSVFSKTLYDQRRMFVWWSLGLAAVSLIYVAGYKQFAIAGMLDTPLPEYLSAVMGVMDYASAEGYLNSTFFTLIGSMMMMVFTITIGARAIAGEEDAGMLDIILAHPVSRTRVVIERYGAMAAATALFALVAWLTISVAAQIAEMGIPLVNILAACTGLALLGLALGSIAFAVGAATGRVGLALGVAIGLALAGFLANNLAPLLEWLEVLQKLSPYYYYLKGDPLREGFDLGGLAVLAAAALVFAGLAVWGLNRRDVAV